MQGKVIQVTVSVIHATSSRRLHHVTPSSGRLPENLCVPAIRKARAMMLLAQTNTRICNEWTLRTSTDNRIHGRAFHF